MAKTTACLYTKQQSPQCYKVHESKAKAVTLQRLLSQSQAAGHNTTRTMQPHPLLL
jgi:hypothetical protein